MKKEKKKAIKFCEYCGNEFEANRSWQKYCSHNCRWADWDNKNPRIKKQINDK